jgi:hypothetical protein
MQRNRPKKLYPRRHKGVRRQGSRKGSPALPPGRPAPHASAPLPRATRPASDPPSAGARPPVPRRASRGHAVNAPGGRPASRARASTRRGWTRVWACPRGPLHDVRRSVAAHMAEELGVEDRVISAFLAHASGGKVFRTYIRAPLAAAQGGGAPAVGGLPAGVAPCTALSCNFSLPRRRGSRRILLCGQGKITPGCIKRRSGPWEGGGGASAPSSSARRAAARACARAALSDHRA